VSHSSSDDAAATTESATGGLRDDHLAAAEHPTVGAPDDPRATADGDAADAMDDQAGAADERRGRRKPRLSFWQELPILILIAGVLSVIIRTFAVQAFYIPSGSMERTLHGVKTGGDRVMVNKLSYRFGEIHRGDIVVFDGKDNYSDWRTPAAPTNVVARVTTWIGLRPQGTDFIKRVIGLPGDHVVCCDANGRVTVNGHALNETYLYSTGGGDQEKTFDTVVPPKHLWVMGDHRDDSQDSRFVGPIPENDVIGRAFVIIWPPSRWRGLGTPHTFQDWPKNAAAASPFLGSVALVTAADQLRRRRRRRTRTTS
jgi:signal peptidase I